MKKWLCSQAFLTPYYDNPQTVSTNSLYVLTYITFFCTGNYII
jgi:hypothetical protein